MLALHPLCAAGASAISASGGMTSMLFFGVNEAPYLALFQRIGYGENGWAGPGVVCATEGGGHKFVQTLNGALSE